MSFPSTPQPFSVPNTFSSSVTDGIPQIVVPDVINNNGIKEVEPWTYKKFSPVDILYSRFGISAITSIATFSLLAYINPVFVQEESDVNNRIEKMKPSVYTLYVISIVIFLFMMFIPTASLS